MTVVTTGQVRLPHPDLDGADWADSYAVELSGDGRRGVDVARAMFADVPRWVSALLAARNAIVRFFGLKSAELTMTGQETVGGFPLLSTSDDRALLGFNDRHLDFRILITVDRVDALQQRVTLTTLVKRHNLFGRLYILVVTPFHRLIVRTFLHRLARQAAVSPPHA